MIEVVIKVQASGAEHEVSEARTESSSKINK